MVRFFLPFFFFFTKKEMSKSFLVKLTTATNLAELAKMSRDPHSQQQQRKCLV